MGVTFEYTIAPETPPNLSCAQFLGLVRALVDEHIFALPAKVISGNDLAPSALLTHDRAPGARRDEPNDVLAKAGDLATLLHAVEQAPYGEQDVCIVFDNFHPLQRGFDPNDPDLFNSEWAEPNAYVALFARPAPRLEEFSRGVFDEEGNLQFTADGDIVEEYFQRPLQHFLVLENILSDAGEENAQLLAVLKRFYGEPLETEFNGFD